MNFFHSTWQSCNGSKGHNEKRNASSTHKGQPSDNGGNERRKNNPDFVPEAKSCGKDEWFLLMKEQQEAVRALRRQAEQKKKQALLDSKEVVAAVTANAVPEDQADGAKTASFEPERQDQAGNQFGRHAHQQ